jgi:putative transposase
VAEAAFKTLKIEFILYEQFASQEALDLGLFDYVNWYNNVRIHSSLGYQMTAEYRKNRAMHSAS